MYACMHVCMYVCVSMCTYVDTYVCQPAGVQGIQGFVRATAKTNAGRRYVGAGHRFGYGR